MLLSKIHRDYPPVALKRIVFAEFDPNGELPAGSWVARNEGQFTPDSPPPASAAPGCVPPAGAEGGAMDPAQLEAQLQEAFARGREQGLEEARERFGTAQEILDRTSETLGQTLEEVSRLREHLLRSSKGDMLRLVMAIARQVIHAEISVNREVVLSTIDRALQAAVSSDAYQVRVNPEDLVVATERKPLFLASISSLKNITFQADPAIARGGCLVESDLGEVDATIDSQLEEIRRLLLESGEQA